MRLVAWVRTTVLAATIGFVAGPAGADDYQDAVDRAHAELDKFQTWVADQTTMLRDEIAELEQELESSTAEDKERLDELIQSADDLTDQLQDQASQIGAATSDQWEEVKASAISGWHRAQAAYYAALAELRGEGGN